MDKVVTDKRSRPAIIAREASEETLLILVGKNQDTDAFNELFTRFSRKIFAQGMKFTRNEQFSKDLVQEAMLLIWQKAPLFDQTKGCAKSWIFALVRNRCFDLLRALKRQPNLVSADDIWPVEYSLSASQTDNQHAFHEIALSEIQRYYKKLPDAQQEVIEQLYTHDKTHEEAAEALDIPLGTVKSRVRLGVRKLKLLIGKEQ